MRLVYQSGDAAFSRMALQAVAKTTFVPDAHIGASSTFDYWLMSHNGNHATRIIGHLRGDQNTSVVADVRVPRGGNAWLANVGDCEISHK